MRTLICAAVLALAAPAAAADAGLDAVICYPAGAMDAGRAEPALARMFAVLERLGGWPAGTFSHRFTSKAAECRGWLAADRPALVIASLGLFLEHREAHTLEPLTAPQVKGRTSETWRVLVRRGAAKDLAALAGKTLGGDLLDEPVFLRRIVFAGAVDPAKHFVLKPGRRALRSLRKLARGELDAVLVNEAQFNALAGLPFAGDLEAVFESAPLPLVGLAADATRTSPAERERLKKAMAGLCADAEGKSLCEVFALEAFAPVDATRYADEVAKWKAAP